MTTTPPPSEVPALQDALRAEHATVYGYGVAGARLTGAERDDVRAAYDAHRARRNELTRLLRDRDVEPAAAEPAYALPGPVETGDDARMLAADLEDGVAVAYARLVAESAGDIRLLGATALREAAVRAARWRGASVAFPGLPDLSAPSTSTAG